MTCPCQWQRHPSFGDVLVTPCHEHMMQNRLAQLEPDARDYHIVRLLDAELDHFVREHAKGRRVEPAQALGPARRG